MGTKVKSDAFRQCIMSKGATKQTAWIPLKFAVVGKSVRLKDTEGVWNVDKVSTIEMPEVTVNARSRDYKKTRKASDI
jgi:hypothetical protein